jgi:UPF0716 family protein affecting phage T7 exclusion
VTPRGSVLRALARVLAWLRAGATPEQMMAAWLQIIAAGGRH